MSNQKPPGDRDESTRVDEADGAESDAPSNPPAQSGQTQPKAAGSVGWQAVAPPGKPDGEVDTRP